MLYWVHIHPKEGTTMKRNRLLTLALALLLLLAVVWLIASPHNPDESNQPAAAESTPASSPDTNNTDDGNLTLIEDEMLDPDGTYTSKEDVALYIHQYGKLPHNFITKREAENLGWTGGSLEPYAPGMCIGGSRFGNYEGLLPEAPGRTYTECDIDTLGASSRGAKRIVFSNDGLIYYTDDHYESFELLYGEADG